MKTLAMLLIGLIIGSTVGYFGNEIITDPIMTDLQNRLTNLEENYYSLEGSFEELFIEYGDLEQELEALQRAYSELQNENEILYEDKQALIDQIEILEAMYESLLNDYQTNFGGLDFSNQTIPVILRNYTWSYDNEIYVISIIIPEPMYQYYNRKERYVTSDYRGYILHPYDDAFLELLLKEFDKIIVFNNLAMEEKVNLVISFVQNLHYLTDENTGYDEYPKFPLESLVDEGGDCEDTSILLAHLLKEMNINTSLLTLPNHMAVGIEMNATGVKWDFKNHTYYYLETTMPGWSIGSMPSEHVGKPVVIDIIEEIPFLMHLWEASRRNNIVDVTITYTNESPIDGSSYSAWIGIELDNGQLYAEKIGSSLNLGFGESMTEKLRIEGPRNKTMRLVVGVITPEGEIITKKYSEYFTTR